jgi:hypothetical protein
MRRRLAALLVALPLTAAAQQEPGWVAKPQAVLQLLDKVTARIAVVEAPVGRAAGFATLSILVRACNARPADEVPDAAAWLEVTDSRRREADKLAFRGWLFANAPGVNMLEHPVYDLRVLQCR